MLIAFPLRKWLHERASMLRYMCFCYNQDAVRLLRSTDWTFNSGVNMHIVVIETTFSFFNYSYQEDKQVKYGKLLGK